MKHEIRFKILVTLNLLLVIGIGWLNQPWRTQAQEPALSGAVGTAFTYQGRLTDGGSPASGDYDFRFILYTAEVGGSQVGSLVSREDVLVSEGFFTVQLDFGPVFDGTARWLEIAVRPGNTAGDYTPLAPRQPLLPAPYALNSASTGSLQGYALSDSAPTPGQVLKWDGSHWKPDTDNSGSAAATYNAGTGLDLNGSNTFSLKSSYRLPQNCTTNQIIKFNGSQWVCAADPAAGLAARVAALENLLVHLSRDGNDLYLTGANLHVVNGTGSTEGDPNSLGNVIIGYNEERPSGNNRSGSHMLVIGMRHNYTRFGGIVAGWNNETSGSYASVSGGFNNTASGSLSSVSGGQGNTASGSLSSVSGGAFNTASGTSATVSGGAFNTASWSYTSVSGGRENTASGISASVSGGQLNTASGDYAAISGGANNTASNRASSVSGGGSNAASGRWSSVSGGSNRAVSGDLDWRAGGYFQDQ